MVETIIQQMYMDFGATESGGAAPVLVGLLFTSTGDLNSARRYLARFQIINSCWWLHNNTGCN